MNAGDIKVKYRFRVKWWAKPAIYACAFFGLDAPGFCFSITVTDPKGA